MTEDTNWNNNAEHINRYVDSLVDTIKNDAHGVPVAYKAVDIVFRPYLQWLHTAHEARINATQTRNSAINLVNMMILEMMSRMHTKQTDPQDITEWVDEFLELLAKELNEDIESWLNRR